MLYTFQYDTHSKSLPELLDFIKLKGSGIFIFAEGFLDVRTDDIKSIAKLTDNGKISVISGIMNYPGEIKACLFAYGTRDIVYDIHQQFLIPSGESQIKTQIRVCSGILDDYRYKDFQLLAHPSSISLDLLLDLGRMGNLGHSTFQDSKNLNDVVIASSSFSDCRIISGAGIDIGKQGIISCSSGKKIHYSQSDIY